MPVIAAGQTATFTVAAGDYVVVSTGPNGFAALEAVGSPGLASGERRWTRINGRRVFGPWQAGTVRVNALADAVDYSFGSQAATDDRDRDAMWASATGTELVRPDGTLVGVAQDIVVDFTPSTGVTGVSEQVLKQCNIPAGALSSCRYFEIKVLYTKSGVTDSATVRLRLGTTGTTSDAQLMQSAVLSAANRTAGVTHSRYAFSNTSLRLVGATPTSTFVGGTSAAAAAFPDNVVVPDVSVTDLILSASMQMSASTDTPTVAHLIVTRY